MAPKGLRLALALPLAWGANAEWTKEAGKNCYYGAGATELDSSPVGTLSVADCEARCDELADCTGITIGNGASTGPCYRRKDINVAECSTSAAYDTYIKSGAPSPTPPSPTPPGPTPPSPSTSLQMQVVSYNLYWWCVSDEYGNCPQFANNVGFNMLYNTIRGGAPFDLIGFQECDDVVKVLNGAGLASRFNYYAPPQDGPMAWDNSKYALIEGPGQVWVANDQYGDRFMNWVRLQVIGTSDTVFFANTHGPLNGCPTGLGDLYINGINAHKQAADKVVLTGDFNCGSGTAAISRISQAFLNAATGDSYSGADHIFTNFGTQVQWQGHSTGAPSDHSLLKAVLATSSVTAEQKGSGSMMKFLDDAGKNAKGVAEIAQAVENVVV